MSFSIIIPAFNEEKYLPDTLHTINQAILHLAKKETRSIEIIVVDNNSSDQTAGVAAAMGATVVSQSDRSISKARNTGAKAASGDTFIFIDADTLIPSNLLWRISRAISDPACAGGTADIDYGPVKSTVRLYLNTWRVLGKITKMTQGATQFCRRSIYDSLGGYDETIFMGEDVDFYWRLKRNAREKGQRVTNLRDVRVKPSCRRFDLWPIWKTIVWTNPIVILLLRKKKEAWKAWYDETVR